MRFPTVAVAAATVLFLVAVIALVVLLLGGFKAEPNYTSWCDSPTGNRLFLFSNGSGAVVPAESPGARC